MLLGARSWRAATRAAAAVQAAAAVERRLAMTAMAGQRAVAMDERSPPGCRLPCCSGRQPNQPQTPPAVLLAWSKTDQLTKPWPTCPAAVVDNLPQVPPEKYDKLTAILTKVGSLQQQTRMP